MNQPSDSDIEVKAARPSEFEEVDINKEVSGLVHRGKVQLTDMISYHRLLLELLMKLQLNRLLKTKLLSGSRICESCLFVLRSIYCAILTALTLVRG